MSRNRKDDLYDDWDLWAQPEEEKKRPSYTAATKVQPDDDWYFTDDPPPSPRKKKQSKLPVLAVIAVVAVLVLGIRAVSGLLQGDDTPGGNPPAAWVTPTPIGDNNTIPAPTTPTATPVPTQTYRYFAKQLTVEQRLVYDRIVAGLMTCEPSISGIRLTSYDLLAPVMEAVFWDYAELFWYTGGWSGSYYTRDGYVDITVTPGYRWDKQTCLSNKAYVESASQTILQQLQGKSDYVKVKGVYDFLIDRTAYNYSHMDTTIYEMFRDRKAVCEGYTRATQYLLTQLGVECIYVVGYGHKELHAWNIVKVEGEYYQLDVTWGDPLHQDGRQTKNYNYLLLTDDEIRREHTAEWYRYPTCTATAYNYYLYEGNYLEAYDMAVLKQWAAEAHQRGEPLTFKAANRAVYEEAKSRLIDNKEMWTMLEGLYAPGTTAWHTLDDDLYVIEFTW